MNDPDELVNALESILSDMDNMGDPDTGRLSPGERDELRSRLDALWERRAEFPLDEMGVALFERARRLVDGALDS
ncbi:MAG TPA: hypothetical protein VGI14_22430 [Casimicrobiaceae bacterium]|jgi:hypothetical protein